MRGNLLAWPFILNQYYPWFVDAWSHAQKPQISANFMGALANFIRMWKEAWWVGLHPPVWNKAKKTGTKEKPDPNYELRKSYITFRWKINQGLKAPLQQCLQPDRPFHNLKASQSGDWRILWRWRIRSDGFWSSKLCEKAFRERGVKKGLKFLLCVFFYSYSKHAKQRWLKCCSKEWTKYFFALASS